MSISLSRRLAAIAAYIKPGSHVADVGTDHGYIPVWLIENRICEHVIASDIRPGPLQRAEITAKNAGVYDKIKFILCSGLESCPADAIDTVIIAGMGGETIISILEADPWAKEKQLIIQPQSKISELREWLAQNGCVILDAQLVSDTGRLYLVWNVGPGPMEVSGIIDRQLLENHDPLLLAYLDNEIKKKLKIRKGLESAAVEDGEALEACRTELAELQKLREEVALWQK